MHKEYIDKIIMTGNDKQMRELKNVLIDTINYVKNTDMDIYNKIECDLYEISEGKVLTEEKAKEWVSNMVPKAKWSLNDVKQLMSSHQINIPIVPAYVIMNMLYSDLGDVLGEGETNEIIDKYIRAAEDWYYDEDAKHTEDEKLYCYWKNIVN